MVQLGLWEALGESGGLCRILNVPARGIRCLLSTPHPKDFSGYSKDSHNSIPGASHRWRGGYKEEGLTRKQLSFHSEPSRGGDISELCGNLPAPPHAAWLKLCHCQQENLQLRRYSDPMVSVWSSVPVPEPNEASPNEGCWRAWRKRDRWGLHFWQKHSPTRKKLEAWGGPKASSQSRSGTLAS